MKVKELYEIEQTGGYVYVGYGSFKDGTYFTIGSDIMIKYDEDEYKAIDSEDYDGYEWEQKHMLDSYSYDTKEYQEVIKQVYEKCHHEAKDLYDLFRSMEGDEK